LIIGAKLTAWARKTLNIEKSSKERVDTSEREPLLAQQKDASDEEAAPNAAHPTKSCEEPPKIRDVLSLQSTLNLVVYTLLALYTLAFDQVRKHRCFACHSTHLHPQLLPVFMHHPRQSIDDPNVSLPLKFAGGFGIGSRRIGAIFTIFSVSTTICQFLVFPPVARYLGVLRCLRIAFLIFPFVYFVTPFLSLLPGQTSKEVAMIVLLMIRGVGGTFAFPCSTIMITNSASSLRVLGTLNGLATTVSAVGRAVGPALGGSLFTLGVKHGYVIVPFWTLSAISLLASIPTWFLVEGKGFGDDPDPTDEEVVSASASGDDDGGDRDLPESEYGEPANLLTHTSTRSSAAFVSDDELDLTADEARARQHRTESWHSRAHGRSSSQSRHSRTVRRRSSVPVGMGIGFRKLSSNLGSTGLGAGGVSWGGT
jgi:hypothetical protein